MASSVAPQTDPFINFFRYMEVTDFTPRGVLATAVKRRRLFESDNMPTFMDWAGQYLL